MAKFFKYKSAEDLTADASARGLDIRTSDDFSPLFSAVQVGPRTVGNRWCIHPMEGCDGEPDGTPGELTFRRYRRFGDGGAKIIWGEACAVTDSAKANPRQIILNDRTLPAFADLVRQCRAAHRAANGHGADLLFGLQLTHSGRYSYPTPIVAVDDPLLAGRTKNGRVISDDELRRLPEDYVRSAKLAQAAGFDFVDVKQCHRYLLSELLGAKTRPGPYGGSYENRTRLAREIFTAIRTEVPGVILATRMNGFDGIPFHKNANHAGVPDPLPGGTVNGWGLSDADPQTPDLTEPTRWAADMAALGVGLINVALGNPYAQPHFGRPFEYPPPDGYESPEHPLVGVDRHFRIAEAIQKAVPAVPVVGTGYSYLQEFLPNVAAANVRDGRIGIAGVGRASLSQPDWVRQLKEHGKLDRKRVCRTFSYCTAIMREKRHPLGQFPTGCPPFDKEAYGGVWQEVQALNVRPEKA